ncbi:dialkylrecorsinol condensing enzyme [Azoarcus sp. DD4]|uniref:dialkylrecorsinol condensing enzyme n=1 Tax=Azoarcus sp. DD4 TaxID=2027405 RepID=UPI0011272902|nr:dialkylrecorsinol condensing enzyme [Azoarcus sp. DD4]QDF95383.1 dialkylrecorsinol condensing enzyme [Azoarcus sp. DD4]
MKKVLVVHYSQTGQLADIVAELLQPLRAAGVAIHEEVLRPARPHPFPWPFFDFLDVFPESVRMDAAPNLPLTVPADADFDLVILAWQVWYLSPSLPVTAFLKSAEGRRLLAGKPVVSVVACRNMWMTAQEKLAALLAEAGARLVDHVALTDDAHPLATFITTPRWMFTGRRDRFLGLPRAGVAPRDVAGAARFGHALAEALAQDGERSGQPMLAGLRAAVVNPRLVISERAGQRAFKVWSALVRACGQPGQRRRRPALALFALYLVTLIITVVPTSLALQTLFAPLLRPRLERLRAQYEQPSGSADFKLAHDE